MTIENVWREGPMPTIPANAGERRTISWTLPDWLAFEREIRSAFPNAFFYEEWSRRSGPAAKPKPRILERLDEAGIEREVCVRFPYPGWEPELVLIDNPRPTWEPFWTWKHHVSPSLRFSVRRHDKAFERSFSSTEPSRVVSVWGVCDLTTSYRRQIPAERQLIAKILRMIERRSRKVVPVYFHSYADYCAGKGEISPGFMRQASCLASKSVIEWAKSGPDRLIFFQSIVENVVQVWMPAELIPESWWTGIRRPKWAQRP